MHTRSNNMILQRAALSFFTFFVPAITLSADVRVLSWNVYMLPSPIKNSLQHSRDIAIPELLKDSDYDIMFFQEAFTYKFRQSMIKRLSDKYPHNYYLKGSKFISAFGSGVFVMSKHPFTVLDKITYKACSGADCVCLASTSTKWAMAANGLPSTLRPSPRSRSCPSHNRSMANDASDSTGSLPNCATDWG